MFVCYAPKYCPVCKLLLVHEEVWNLRQNAKQLHMCLSTLLILWSLLKDTSSHSDRYILGQSPQIITDQ